MAHGTVPGLCSSLGVMPWGSAPDLMGRPWALQPAGCAHGVPPGLVATSWFLTHFLFFNSFLAFLRGSGAAKAEREKLAAGTGYGDSARFREDLGSESFGGFHLCMGNVPGGLSHEDISKPRGCSSEPWLQLPWAA